MAKGYQTKQDGHYAYIKIGGKSYVSSKFPLDTDPDLLQHEVDAWRSVKRLEVKKAAGVTPTELRGSLARDIRRFLARTPEGRKKVDFNTWLTKWADCPLGAKQRFIITTADVRNQLDAWGKGEDAYSASSLNHLRQALLSLWKELDPDGKQPPCPAKGIKKRTEDNTREGFFEEADFLKVLAELPADHQDFARFAYYSGWRRAEISGLVWSEVDLKHREIRLPGSRTKNGKPRTLPIEQQLHTMLSRRFKMRAERGASPHVFTYVNERRFKGQVLPIQDFRKVWERATKTAGVPDALIHDFRRTAARNLIRKGVSEAVSMKWTGHLTRSMLDRYNVTNAADMREAAKKMDAGLNLGLTENQGLTGTEPA